MRGIDRVEDDEDGFHDHEHPDREQHTPHHETAAAHELQHFGLDEPHSLASSLDVISRNFSSSDARAGSSLETATPASTSARLISAGRVPACSLIRSACPFGLDRQAVEHAPRRRLVVDLEQKRWIAARGDFLDAALDDDPAPVDDRDLVAGLLDLVEQVGGEEHRPALVTNARIRCAHLEDAGGVEAVHRLVEDQQGRVGDQAARDAEALAHAERVGLHAVVPAVGEADPLERLGDARIRRAVPRGRDDAQVLSPGQVRVEPRFLDDRADPCQRLGALRRLREAE